MADLLQNLGGRIRTFRTAANLSRVKLAEKAKISTYYVGEIERGEGSPSLSVCQDLAKALGISLKDLFDFPNEGVDEVLDEIVAMLKREE